MNLITAAVISILTSHGCVQMLTVVMPVISSVSAGVLFCSVLFWYMKEVAVQKMYRIFTVF